MSELRIGIVAAEPSADLLAAGLMQALRERLPQVRFEGVAGPLMRQHGIDAWEDMDSLSVMGLFEVLRHLPRLLRLRARLLARWRDTPPAAFIGVDAPDFNLTVEQRLREHGVPTIHYVSPTVWAWRSGRVHKIDRALLSESDLRVRSTHCRGCRRETESDEDRSLHHRGASEPGGALRVPSSIR